ncbi:cytochrome d ubiquinol oxidase subunit II [Actinopolymorpha pittospori]
MELQTVWFVLIGALWTGYFVLEGFDFGVGALLPVLGRHPLDRRALLQTVGPRFDANEVWLLVAVAATFAAFPPWYAALFSAFYVPVLLILLTLVARVIAVAFRDRRSDPTWQVACDRAIVLGSLVPPLLWGLTFAALLRGLPIDQHGEYLGVPVDVLSPFALLGGLTVLALSVTHGAVFLTLRTTGSIRDRARRVAGIVGVVTAALLVWFLFAALGPTFEGSAVVTAIASVATLGAGLLAGRAGREGWAFVGTAITIALLVSTLFLTLYPDLIISTIDPEYSLTVDNASSTPSTLGLLTWVAGLFLPLVVAYQAWSYWVFRQRVGRGTVGTPPSGSS